MKLLLIARLGSKRFPKKHFTLIKENVKSIDYIISNLLENFEKDDIILCTSNNDLDKELIEYVNKRHQIKCYAGDENNVLKRIFNCLKVIECEYFVRINADNVLTDGKLIKSFCMIHEVTKSEFTTNVSPRTISKGLSFQACSKKLFIEYYNKVKNNQVCQEHVFIKMSNYTNKHLNISFDSSNLLIDDFALDTTEDLYNIQNTLNYNKSIYWNE